MFTTFYKSKLSVTLLLLIFGSLLSVKVLGQDTITRTNNLLLKDTLLNKKITYIVVDEMPEYPGGIVALRDFLSTNVKHPSENKKKHILGKVITTFVIDENGQVVDPEIIKSWGKDYDNEVLRVINLMPKWKPGRQNNKNVRVKFCIPVPFK